MRTLTLQKLKETLTYDPATGVFTRLLPLSRFGCKAGTISKKESYIYIRIDKKEYAAHRLAWLYMTGAWPEPNIDHKNCDRTDNRWANLRLASDLENSQNSLKPKSNTSGYKGAVWHTRDKFWYAQIRAEGKTKWLGKFASAKAAHAAYIEAARHYHGLFARAA